MTQPYWKLKFEYAPAFAPSQMEPVSVAVR